MQVVAAAGSGGHCESRQASAGSDDKSSRIEI